jgi:hypothetical protein
MEHQIVVKQPGQTAHVGHGTAPARFRNVKVGVEGC